MSDDQIDLDIEYHVEGVAEDTERFTRAASWIAGRFGLERLTASVAIVDDATIHDLNRERLGHDWPTDVISFVFENDSGRVEGEVIASSDMASRVCTAAGWSQKDELLLYVIHGMLHLAGLDDIVPEDQLAMRSAEQECLMALAVSRADEHLARWSEVSY